METSPTPFHGTVTLAFATLPTSVAAVIQLGRQILQCPS